MQCIPPFTHLSEAVPDETSWSEVTAKADEGRTEIIIVSTRNSENALFSFDLSFNVFITLFFYFLKIKIGSIYVNIRYGWNKGWVRATSFSCPLDI